MPASDDADWTALLARDAAATFVYGVTTTGIACRPACPSRRPLRANVRFFAAYAEAAVAGFRACRRCRPDEAAPNAVLAQAIERACRLIDEVPEPPSLAALAAAAGLSPFHFHRVFRAAVGVTPKAYVTARRRERLQRTLPGAATVTAAAYDAGYASSARFYANADAELGMAPNAYRRGAPEGPIRFACGTCSLGAILVAATERGVCAIDLGDDPDALRALLLERFPRATFAQDDAALGSRLAAAVALADGAVADRAPAYGVELPLDIAGSAFAQRVWSALREVPLGKTATYGEIARRIGAPGSARAVAKACAANPVAIAIPCHRAVRGDGAETAYRWGAPRKRELLRRERAKSGVLK